MAIQPYRCPRLVYKNSKIGLAYVMQVGNQFRLSEVPANDDQGESCSLNSSNNNVEDPWSRINSLPGQEQKSNFSISMQHYTYSKDSIIVPKMTLHQKTDMLLDLSLVCATKYLRI